MAFSCTKDYYRYLVSVILLAFPLFFSSCGGRYFHNAGLPPSLSPQYTYSVYDGETQTVGQVEQEITGYETSKLFEGEAFKVKTRFQGQKVTTWIDRRGYIKYDIWARGERNGPIINRLNGVEG